MGFGGAAPGEKRPCQHSNHPVCQGSGVGAVGGGIVRCRAGLGTRRRRERHQSRPGRPTTASTAMNGAAAARPIASPLAMVPSVEAPARNALAIVAGPFDTSVPTRSHWRSISSTTTGARSSTVSVARLTRSPRPRLLGAELLEFGLAGGEFGLEPGEFADVGCLVEEGAHPFDTGGGGEDAGVEIDDLRRHIFGVLGAAGDPTECSDLADHVTESRRWDLDGDECVRRQRVVEVDVGIENASSRGRRQLADPGHRTCDVRGLHRHAGGVGDEPARNGEHRERCRATALPDRPQGRPWYPPAQQPLLEPARRLQLERRSPPALRRSSTAHRRRRRLRRSAARRSPGTPSPTNCLGHRRRTRSTRGFRRREGWLRAAEAADVGSSTAWVL